EDGLAHIDKHEDSIKPAYHLGGGGECKGWHQHRLSGFEGLDYEGQTQRVGAVGAAQHVLGAAEGGELLFEDGDLRAHDVFAVVDDAENGLVDAAAKAPPLRAQI